ncbi:PH domain-containing protein [Acinetobacter sp. ANC 4648]
MNNIQKIEQTRDPLSVPILSLNRIKIKYKKDSVLIEFNNGMPQICFNQK